MPMNKAVTAMEVCMTKLYQPLHAAKERKPYVIK